MVLRYPDRVMMTFSIVPSPKVSDTVVEPYKQGRARGGEGSEGRGGEFCSSKRFKKSFCSSKSFKKHFCSSKSFKKNFCSRKSFKKNF